MARNESLLCHDCGAKPGELHAVGCDVEQCSTCGGQRISCDCDQPLFPRIPWDGEWPGKVACREFGFWSRWTGAPWEGGRGWVRCPKDHPEAGEDLNRLHAEATWDPNLRKWTLNPEMGN